MAFDPRHLRDHLADLRGRIAFLRPLQPDNPSYKLWLGDVVEVVNLQWGVDSVQMARLRAAIGRGGRHPDAESDDERTAQYLARLSDLEAVLESFERGAGSPITFFE
jgi:hypothetical protein